MDWVAFPAARFIFLYREPRQNISSIIEAWKSGKFVTYPNLDGWPGLPWSLLLIPGWKDLKSASLPHIALRQWHDANHMIITDLEEISERDWIKINYKDLVMNKFSVLKKICDFIEIPFDEDYKNKLLRKNNFSQSTLTSPDENKWKINAAGIEPLIKNLDILWERINHAR